MGAFHRNALRSGHRLAEYVIESVLGHGGFGITYLARDRSLGALVAIKEYLPHDIATRDNKTVVMPSPAREAVRDFQTGLKNFVKEARALARFKHSNIVRVLRYLQANGTAYMVMEYEEGHSLSDYLKRHGPRLDEQTILRVFIPILNGLYAVHQAEMLHLDIKPENIYLRKNGSPMLIDFGSARRGTAQMNKVALTHGYAPMEQYPEKGTPGPWTDVYAIGASMYRCISGRKPEDALERYQAILKYQVDPLTPAVKAGKNSYQRHVLECVDWSMQVYPRDRPQTARELQEALMGRGASTRLAAASQPAKFRSTSSMGGGKRVFASKPVARKVGHSSAVAWMAAGLMVASLSLAGFLYWSGIITQWKGFGNFLTLTSAIDTKPAEKFSEKNVATRIEPEFIKPPLKPVEKSSPPGVPAPRLGSTTKSVAFPSHLDNTLTGHQDWIQSLAFSPDGKWFASASLDRSIRLWETNNGSLLGTLQQSYAVNAVAISSDGMWLASVGDDGTVRLWEAKTGTPRGALSVPNTSVYTVAFSPNGKLIAAAGKDRNVYVWEVNGGKRVLTLEGHTGDIYSIAFSPDGKFLASGGADKTIHIWKVANGAILTTLVGHNDRVMSVVYSPNGRWLASGDAGKAIRLWDAASATHVRTITNDTAVLTLSFSMDSRWLAAGLIDNTIQIFDVSSGMLAQTLTGHQDYVQSVAFSPESSLLISAGRDKTIRFWK